MTNITCVYDHIKKMSELSLSNYPDLHLSDRPCILKLSTTTKEKTHGT
jgi:hypothetical protein